MWFWKLLLYSPKTCRIICGFKDVKCTEHLGLLRLGDQSENNSVPDPLNDSRRSTLLIIKKSQEFLFIIHGTETKDV